MNRALRSMLVAGVALAALGVAGLPDSGPIGGEGPTGGRGPAPSGAPCRRPATVPGACVGRTPGGQRRGRDDALDDRHAHPVATGRGGRIVAPRRPASHRACRLSRSHRPRPRGLRQDADRQLHPVACVRARPQRRPDRHPDALSATAGRGRLEQPGRRVYNTFERNTGELYAGRDTWAHYAILIDYNVRRIRQGAGSGFFLHVGSSAPTAGCVGAPLATLRGLLRWLDPRARPRIVISTRRVTTTCRCRVNSRGWHCGTAPSDRTGW